MKRAAETLNFLTEHGIGSLEDLSERCDGAAAATARVKADLRATEKEMERLTLTMKHAATYRQLRPMYDQYLSLIHISGTACTISLTMGSISSWATVTAPSLSETRRSRNI